MRSEKEMMDIIMNKALSDERIRAVTMEAPGRIPMPCMTATQILTSVIM